MAVLSISLPDTLKSFVEEESTKRNFSTSSEYVRALIRQEQNRIAREELEEKILEGLNSQPGVTLTEDSWEEIKLEARRRAGKIK